MGDLEFYDEEGGGFPPMPAVDINVLFADMPELKGRLHAFLQRTIDNPDLGNMFEHAAEAASGLDGRPMMVDGANWSKDAALLRMIVGDDTRVTDWIRDTEELLDASIDVLNGEGTHPYATSLEEMPGDPNHTYWISIVRYIRQACNLKQLLVALYAFQDECESDPDSDYSINPTTFREFLERRGGQGRLDS
jgi:hypothetical protein